MKNLSLIMVYFDSLFTIRQLQFGKKIFQHDTSVNKVIYPYRAILFTLLLF